MKIEGGISVGGRTRATSGLRVIAHSRAAMRVGLGVGTACLSLSLMCAQSAQAATSNSEAASPYRSESYVATKPKPIQKIIVLATNREGDGIPDRTWGGALKAERIAPATEAAPNVLKAPAKPMAKPADTQAADTQAIGTPLGATRIAIAASEPEMTSRVRTPDVAPFQKIGAPYQAKGVWYVPAHEPDYDETGTASWYGAQFQGQKTANGEIFDMNVATAAHPTLPIPSLVEVTNLDNGRSLVVRVNDRGPFVGNRLIDLSARGAQLLGFEAKGSAPVRVRYVGAATLEPLVTTQTLTPVRHYAALSASGSKPKAFKNPVKTAGISEAAGTGADQKAFVQLGVFAQRANAERVRQQASNLGAVRIVPTANAQGDALFKVVLGPMSTGIQAEEKVQAVLASGFSGARVLLAQN